MTLKSMLMIAMTVRPSARISRRLPAIVSLASAAGRDTFATMRWYSRFSIVARSARRRSSSSGGCAG